MLDSTLVSGPELLKLLWEKPSRPSMRWLRERQKQGDLPYVKIGGKVFFDVEGVKLAIATTTIGGGK